MDNTIGYCVKCKAKIAIENPEEVEITGKRGTRKAVKGFCPHCGTKMYRILSKKDIEEKIQEIEEKKDIEKEIKGFDEVIQ